LPKQLSLPGKSHVRVTIESDVERQAWLKLSEENLLKTWDNDADRNLIADTWEKLGPAPEVDYASFAPVCRMSCASQR
jgi:hypothetical protein